jgi:nicotinate-nucleotide adenylyltransferase
VTRKTGVFGGSFNPVHYGHLLLADEVMERAGLDRVLFVPAGVPPHKTAAELAPPADRYAMVSLAVATNARFEVSDVELRRAGPSYTVDTLTELSRSKDEELFLVIGSETFLDLLTWREPRRVASLARLIVVPREGGAFDPAGAAAVDVLRKIGAERFVEADGGRVPPDGVLLVRATSLPLAASDLRARVATGRSVAYRMPDAVIAYIRARGLYAEEETQ